MRNSEDWDRNPTQSRFTVSVEFTVCADCVDDAQAEVNEIIQEGVLVLSKDDREPLYAYDIVDVNLAEVE